MATRVYGSSDDLIEFEGDFREEIGGSEDPTFLIFSDGTIAKVKYGKECYGGVWSIEVLRPGDLYDRLELCFDAEAEVYSDQLFFLHGITHVYRTNKLKKV